MDKVAKNEIDIASLAGLARLELKQNEILTLNKDFESILEYVALLSNLNLDEIEPTAHVMPMANNYRPDEATDTMKKCDALANAPEILDDDYIKVPAVIDTE